MANYSNLDEFIIKAISKEKNPWDCYDCIIASHELAIGNWRERMRIMVGRLKQLEESKKIKYQENLRVWRLVGAKEQ